MAMRGPSLLGKRALVVGLLNKHSLAASVTHALLAHGASCVVASRTPLTESQINACAFETPFASHTKHSTHLPSPIEHTQLLRYTDCDVENDESIGTMMAQCADAFDGELDILVHSVAFAPRETFKARGTLLATREAWNQALDVSAYSLIALTRAAYPMLTAGSERDRSVMALSYAGASKVSCCSPNSMSKTRARITTSDCI
jgi:enoyl-[acyl-carrier protein] reductase I